VAQQELRQPVAGAHPVEPGVLAGAHQVARRLELPRRDPDRLEQPAGVQARKLSGVTGIGLDALARPRGNEPRRHHLAGGPALHQVAVEAEAGRACLVADARARPARDGALDSRVVVGQRALVEQLVGARTAASRTGLLCTSRATVTVSAVGLDMVGDLRLWLYRAHPGNPRRCAGADHCR